MAVSVTDQPLGPAQPTRLGRLLFVYMAQGQGYNRLSGFIPFAANWVRHLRPRSNSTHISVYRGAQGSLGLPDSARMAGEQAYYLVKRRNTQAHLIRESVEALMSGVPHAATYYQVVHHLPAACPK